MTALHGKNAKVVVASATVAEIKEWSLDSGRDKAERTSFGDSGLPSKSYIMGLVDSTAKFSGNLDMTDTNGQVALYNSMTSDATLTIKLYLDATHYFTITSFVEKFGAKVSISDIETVDWDIVITSAVPAYS
jgi:hypothetical protein